MSECDSCAMKSDAACAECLGLTAPSSSPPLSAIDGAPLDLDGYPILPDCRVYVLPRPGLAGGALVRGFSGFVLKATADQVDIEEMGTFHSRNARPAEMRVQKGTTKGALEHRIAAEALRGTTQKRKGLVINAPKKEKAKKK